MPLSRPSACLLLAVLCFAAPAVQAQAIERVPFVAIGGERDERARLAQLLVPGSGDDVLLRSTSRSIAWGTDTTSVQMRIILPELTLSFDSALPYTWNNGPAADSRGTNVLLSGGFEVRRDHWRLLVAPQFSFEQNLPFQVIPFPQDTGSTRSIWSNPFHRGAESIDLPLRFGDVAHARLDPGQSSLTFKTGSVEVGAATENVWWGPGIRNAIVLSNNAAGFPHLLARSAEPIATRVGVFGFDAMLGRLEESEYFDTDQSNDVRILAGGALTWQRSRLAGLQLGVSRLRLSGSTGHDQISSLFGRWLFAPAGFEAYFEWARFQDPTSLRDFLEYPTHSQGHTYGLQWARSVARQRRFRLQAEVTYLEPSASIRLRPVATSYTSATVPQGFTNRGEVLGATIGPGSSSQWLAGDLFAHSWRVGLFAGRTRYDNGVLFAPQVPALRAPDVSLLGGIRAGGDLFGTHLSLEYSHTARINYLFQAGYVADRDNGGFQGVDISNRRLSITVSAVPRL